MYIRLSNICILDDETYATPSETARQSVVNEGFIIRILLKIQSIPSAKA